MGQILIRRIRLPAVIILVLISYLAHSQNEDDQQLARLLKRYPQADINGDGRLTRDEVDQVQRRRRLPNRGVPREFEVDAGWENERFPEGAVAYRSADAIRAVYTAQAGEKNAVVSYPEQPNGVLRIVGTGHSFMAPGYKTLPLITKAAGFVQPLYTHTGGGITGSARYKWEQENGIFQFEGKPEPKLLASIANAQWEAMMWGPYFNDRPEYYACWIEFCLKYNPGMTFFLSDAWPQLYQLGKTPKSEAFFTEAVFEEMGRERTEGYKDLIKILRNKYSTKVYLMPTSDAMVLAAKHFLRGELPGIEGLHKAVGGKERSLWRDRLGHLGPGFERLEGYVFYATLYGRSPELITQPIEYESSRGFPSEQLDTVFRRIAWQAVIGNPLSGHRDVNGDGLAD